MQTKRVLITDIDNTLFDWFSMWYHSFSAMMNATATISGLPMSELLDAARGIHQKYGTAEYAFLLEELPPLIQLYGTRESIRQHLRMAIDAYRSARQANMQPYPGVVATLRAIRANGHTVLAFSESKSYYSSYRIRELGLDGIVNTVYCPGDHALPPEKKSTLPLSITECHLLPELFKKPNRQILSDILSDTGFTPEEALYVGDSKSKDIRMAVDAGVEYLWFEFGASHLLDRPDEYELLRRVSHWTQAEIEAERQLSLNASDLVIPPARTIQNYADVTQYFA
jgi:phosphoglycolate phosphatase